jgi:hypothetical protein
MRWCSRILDEGRRAERGVGRGSVVGCSWPGRTLMIALDNPIAEQLRDHGLSGPDIGSMMSLREPSGGAPMLGRNVLSICGCLLAVALMASAADALQLTRMSLAGAGEESVVRAKSGSGCTRYCVRRAPGCRWGRCPCREWATACKGRHY